jgi:hypothetical protein
MSLTGTTRWASSIRRNSPGRRSEKFVNRLGEPFVMHRHLLIFQARNRRRCSPRELPQAGGLFLVKLCQGTLSHISHELDVFVKRGPGRLRS